MSVEGKMRAVLDALADLEREWSHGPMPPSRISRVFHPEHVKECRDAFFFRLGVVGRLNALFYEPECNSYFAVAYKTSLCNLAARSSFAYRLLQLGKLGIAADRAVTNHCLLILRF